MRIPLQLVLPLALIAAASAYAAESGQPAAVDPPAAPAAAPPSGAGRIALVSGNVAIYQLGQSDWTRAEVGLPVATGVWLATDPKARAELQLGPAAADIASGTQLSFTDLQERATEIALSRGRIEVHLHQLPEGGSFQIDLPSGGVRLAEPGSYDIMVGTDGRPSRIAVFAGSARFAGAGLDQTITAGNALLLKGAGESRSASVEPAKPDEFARWSRSRNDREQAASADKAPTAPPPAVGRTEAEEPAAPAHEAGRHARAERHRRYRHHHYARVFHHRRYGYAVAGPVLPNPLSIIGSLLPFR
ncbi:MAG TPA: hypothetical protein VHU15_18420 [Stellaceae bacterium]|nr:hypothetical protein [Stellaceae bacterium]